MKARGIREPKGSNLELIKSGSKLTQYSADFPISILIKIQVWFKAACKSKFKNLTQFKGDVFALFSELVARLKIETFTPVKIKLTALPPSLVEYKMLVVAIHWPHMTWPDLSYSQIFRPNFMTQNGKNIIPCVNP